MSMTKLDRISNHDDRRLSLATARSLQESQTFLLGRNELVNRGPMTVQAYTEANANPDS